jgi:predicted DNA-binding transcriptional regulator AlpA
MPVEAPLAASVLGSGLNSTKSAITPLLLRRDEVARLINVAGRTFDRLVATNQFPPADVRVGAKIVRWKKETISSWIDAGGKL